MDLDAAYVPARADVVRYKRLRQLGKDLNVRIGQTVPRSVIDKAANALGILHKGALRFDTEDTAAVLFDSCFFDWPVEGKSVIERYVETQAFPVSSEEQELLQFLLRAEYHLLIPAAVRKQAGIYFLDAFTGNPIFVMDLALSQSHSIHPGVWFATRLIPLGAYWMTGGAGLPLELAVRQHLLPRLEAEGILKNGQVTDRRRLARMTIRACLKAGAAERVQYEDLEGVERQNLLMESSPPQQRMIAPGRNEPCSCGSGKKYKKCCGAKGR